MKNGKFMKLRFFELRRASRCFAVRHGAHRRADLRGACSDAGVGDGGAGGANGPLVVPVPGFHR